MSRTLTPGKNGRKCAPSEDDVRGPVPNLSGEAVDDQKCLVRTLNRVHDEARA